MRSRHKPISLALDFSQCADQNNGPKTPITNAIQGLKGSNIRNSPSSNTEEFLRSAKMSRDVSIVSIQSSEFEDEALTKGLPWRKEEEQFLLTNYERFVDDPHIHQMETPFDAGDPPPHVLTRVSLHTIAKLDKTKMARRHSIKETRNKLRELIGLTYFDHSNRASVKQSERINTVKKWV